ncbi:MAG: hypothetical protein OXC09_08870 [Truepera sp.]|nr:hypothetical protein [Truepera sp.]
MQAMHRDQIRLALVVPLLAPLLASCLTRTDSLAPVVSITDPRSGATRTTEDLVIAGYALDDEGIVAIRVNGSDLMSSEFYSSEMGMKLVQFKFQPLQAQEGEIVSVIEVEDRSGRVSRLIHRLVVDATTPTLELNVTELGEGRLRVQGVARDNLSVQTIRVAEIPLQFIPSAEHAFILNVTPEEGATIEVVDGAGNRLTRPLQ